VILTGAPDVLRYKLGSVTKFPLNVSYDFPWDRTLVTCVIGQ